MKALRPLVKLLVPVFALAGEMSATALDGVRTSANYTIRTDTLDTGGQRATSGGYTMDDSVGGIGGFSVAVLPVKTVRHGYIGQLYEVTSMVVTAVPASVSEAGNSQLGAIASLDDGTVLFVAGSNVNWGSPAYPISSISVGGLVMPAAVYTDTTGAVSGYYLGASNSIVLLVIDTNPDNFGIYASDGIPDSWQIQYFGLNSTNGVATADPDGTGQNNLFKYLAGLDPTNPASVFRVTSILKAGNDIRVTWTCVGGHSYVLGSSDPFTPPAYSAVVVDASPVISVPGAGESTTNYLDVAAAYAPVLTPPSNPIATTGTPSTVHISATGTRGLAGAAGNAVPVGSLLMLGTFSISDATIQSNFTARNLGAIMSAFTPYGTSFAVGDGTALTASWEIQRSAAGYGGKQIYLLAIDALTLPKANQLGIFTAPSWVFPNNGDQISIALEDVTDFVLGAQGGPLTISLPVGPPYTFDDTAKLKALPGRARFYRVRLAP